MDNIDITDFDINKYEKKIQEAKFFRSKRKELTIYAGFESMDHEGCYVLRLKDGLLDIFKYDSTSPIDMISNLEGKHMLEAFNETTWEKLGGNEKSKFMGA